MPCTPDYVPARAVLVVLRFVHCSGCKCGLAAASLTPMLQIMFSCWTALHWSQQRRAQCDSVHPMHIQVFVGTLNHRHQAGNSQWVLSGR
jgi:hypothetical protein